MELKQKNLLPYYNSILILLSIIVIFSIIIFLYRGYNRLLDTHLTLHDTSFDAVTVDSEGRQQINRDVLKDTLNALTVSGGMEQEGNILAVKAEINLLLGRYEGSEDANARDHLTRQIMHRLDRLMLENAHLLEGRLHSLAVLGIFAVIAFLIYFISTMGLLARRFQEEYNARMSRRSRDLLQSIREKERDRLALVLHDHVLQNMAALSMQPELNSSPELKGAFRDINNNLRTIIQGLHPEHLEHSGLEASLRDFIRCFCSKETEFHLKFDLKEEIRGDLLLIFSILQELLLNLSEHAHADNAYISLSSMDSSLEISIEDDGVGFKLDPHVKDYTEKGPTLGLIQHQIKFAEGLFDIRSTPGGGCSIYILYPLKPE